MTTQRTLHVVTTLVGGYAREDGDVARVTGVYSSPELANLVKKVCGSRAMVTAVVVDDVPPGYIRAAQELFPEAAARLLPGDSSR